MSILNATQIAAAARAFAQQQFVTPNVTANLNLTQIIAGITAIDTVMSDSPAAFNTAYGTGGTNSFNVGSAFGAAVSAAVPGSTVAQQGVMLIFWCQQVTGIA